MVHSDDEFEGTKVESFVMSVIEAASYTGFSATNNANSADSVSRHPISPTSSKTAKLQSSQELVEDTLGSLSSLISVSSATYIKGTDSVVIKTTTGRKLKSKKETLPRKSILRRKRSSLKTLSPEDLGHVSSSSSSSPIPQSTSLSQQPLPSLLVTLPSSSQSSTPVDKYFNGAQRSNSVHSFSKTDHPSTFHLRKPISSYRKIKDNDCNSSSHSNNNDNHKSKSEIKSSSANVTRRAGGSGNKVEGQRSPNYTDDSNPSLEPFRLHNNSNNNAGTVSDLASLVPADNKPSDGGNNDKDGVGQSLIYKSNIDLHAVKQNDDDRKGGRRKLEYHVDDVGDGCHGRMCVHHYHHHSHHHHYHIYDNHSLPTFHHLSHPPFRTNNNNQRDDNQQPQQSNSIIEDRLNLQQHYLHNHSNDMIKTTKDHSSPAEKPPKSPPPPHDPPDDISFYRKFSATSPIVTKRRSRSSHEWPAERAAELSVVGINTGGGQLCSKRKRQKSRSTPIKLDGIGIRTGKPTPFEVGMEYQYGCKCGGCHYCCNELSCNCCCDECCCARQFSHVEIMADNDDDAIMGKRRHTMSSLGKKTAAILKRISRSLESLKIGKDEDIVITDDDDDDEHMLNDPDSFIDDQLLRHLELFDGGSDDDINEAEEDVKGLGENNSDNDEPGQVQVVSINGENAATPGEHDHNDREDDDIKNRIASMLVVGKIHDRRHKKTSDAVTTTETTASKSDGDIVIVSKTPTRSSTDHVRNDDGDGDCNTRRSSSTSGNRRRRRTRNILRTANGEIRSSPITLHENYKETGGDSSFTHGPDGVVVLETQTRHSALLTVTTTDTMSLFLDAVHVKINRD